MGGGFHGIPLTYNLSYLINARLFLIKTFINDVLKVPGDIPLHVAHRLRKRRDRRPRSIVAKFEHRKDRDRVLEVVKTGVLNETDFSASDHKR
jgi:hypothetical protein